MGSIHRRRFGRALAGASASVGSLAPGYIYPREQRPVRDLLRKRSQLVRQRTTNLLSIQNLYTRNTGQALSANRIKQLKVEDIDGMLSASDLTLAIKANLSVLRSADEQVQILEQAVGERVKLRPEFSFLKTVQGIGRFWMFQRQHCIKLFTMCMQRSGAATILF
jgi:transposase